MANQRIAATILRRNQVEQKIGLSRSSLYKFMSMGIFPKPVSLGPRAVGWLESDVDAWISGRISASKKEAA